MEWLGIFIMYRVVPILMNRKCSISEPSWQHTQRQQTVVVYVLPGSRIAWYKYLQQHLLHIPTLKIRGRVREEIVLFLGSLWRFRETTKECCIYLWGDNLFQGILCMVIFKIGEPLKHFSLSCCVRNSSSGLCDQVLIVLCAVPTVLSIFNFVFLNG